MAKLGFFHIPKSAGTYVRTILDKFDIKYYYHNLPQGNEPEITFTIIRHPIERFESFLNYILQEGAPRENFPIHLRYIYRNKSVTLDKIIEKMTDDEIITLTGNGYNLLKDYETVDHKMTIDGLKPFLNSHGYHYKDIPKINVSKKERGKFSKDTKERLERLFKEDIDYFRKLQRSHWHSSEDQHQY